MIKKTNWGFFVFISSIILIGLLFIGNKWHPYVFLPRKVIFLLCGIFSALVFLSGHFSYSRVSNCKVYLLGYLSSLAGISYSSLQLDFIKMHCPVVPKGFFGCILTLMLVNCIVIGTVPSYVKYRITRSITLTIFTIELVLIMVARFAPQATIWMASIKFYSYHDLFFWIGPVLFGITLLISSIFLKKEFFIGGIISGIAIIYAMVWILGINEFSPTSMQLVIFTSALLFTLTGIMIHWFSKMDHRIAYDPLLQIYNRDFCSRIISEQSEIDSSAPFTIAMVDIDHFKNVNDTYGHQAGDEVLFAVAQAVCNGVAPLGIACRYGGEELAVFFSHRTIKEVVKVMEKVRLDIEKLTTQYANKKICVTISCGVSQRESLRQSVQQVIHAADNALYRAKKGGRNQIKSGKI